jgi:outer membrane protein assembly factor BamE (lipoprotein component of BamABCDE complex)
LFGGETESDVHGTYVGPETIAQVQPGKDEAYVRALIGAPDSVHALADGTELWKWSYLERKESSTSIIFVFGSRTETETRSTAYVEFKDGLVQRAWRE